MDSCPEEARGSRNFHQAALLRNRTSTFATLTALIGNRVVRIGGIAPFNGGKSRYERGFGEVIGEPAVDLNPERRWHGPARVTRNRENPAQMARAIIAHSIRRIVSSPLLSPLRQELIMNQDLQRGTEGLAYDLRNV